MSSPSPVLKNILNPRPAATIETTSRNHIGNDESDILDTLAVVVEHTPVAIAMFDRHMRYVLANKQWVQEFNLSQSLPLVGKSQYEVFPKLHPGWRQLYERALQGYTMRSDHPLQAAQGGAPVLFRCEVRPWRQKRDASVAGVVVTCSKFTGSAATPAASDGLDLAATELPIFLLDHSGCILAANPRAAELSLARGLEEGVTSLWEVLADETGRPALKKTFEELAARLRDTPALPPQILTLKTSFPTSATPEDGDEEGRVFQPPCRWMLARHGEDGARLTLVGLTGLSPFEAVAKVGIHLPAPPNGHAPTDETRAPRAATMSNENHEREIASLREQVNRLQLELRTHREAEKTIARREAQRQSILEALPGGLLILNEQGQPQWHNSRLRQLFGRGIDADITIEDWLGLACPEEEHRREVQRVWREDIWRRQLTRTLSLVTREGLLREIELRPSSLAQDGLLVFFQDVTANCRLEEQMSALESKFRALFQDNPLPIVSADKAGSIFDANRAALELFQRPKAELRRLPVDALLSPEAAAARRDALREMRQSGELRQRFTVRLAGDDAPRMHLTLAAVPAAEGEIHSTLHFFETPLTWSAPPAAQIVAEPQTPDPIEPPAAEEAPEPAAPAPVLLLATSANGRIQTWTEQAAAIFGFTAAETAGMPLHLLFQPSDASAFYGVTLPAAARMEQVDWPFYGREGRRGRLSCLIRPSPNGGQQVTIWASENMEA